MSEFIYQEPFPISEDTTEYRLLTKDYVKTVECDGRKILKIDPKGLELLSREADVSFYLRASHLQKLADILNDPEATDNDKFVAYTMLLNQAVSAEGELPTCQDTGTAIVIGKKGEDVYTGANDAEALLRNVSRPQPALFAGGAVHDDRREKFGDEPAGADRLVRDAGQQIQLPVHHQRGRIGE